MSTENSTPVTLDRDIVHMLYTPPEVFNPGLLKPRKRRVLVIASYCQDDSEDCTEERPCNDCLRMCNVAEVVFWRDAVVRQFL